MDSDSLFVDLSATDRARAVREREISRAFWSQVLNGKRCASREEIGQLYDQMVAEQT